MVWINAGYFQKGSPASELNRGSFETLHEVTLTSGFYMGKYEVTQAQYEMVRGVTITAQQAEYA
jgi:formylglycine-generating enzyme required for sulfatase activity